MMIGVMVLVRQKHNVTGVKNESSASKIALCGDIAKGIGIILIAAGHIFPISMGNQWLCAFHVPLFFVISGFTYNPSGDPGKFLQRKFSRLMIPADPIPTSGQYSKSRTVSLFGSIRWQTGLPPELKVNTPSTNGRLHIGSCRYPLSFRENEMGAFWMFRRIS